jgi:hypothetical protein
MRIFCWIGWHDWSIAKNVRRGSTGSDNLLSAGIAVFGSFLGFYSYICDRKCLRCGKEKVFDYDEKRG